MINAFVNKNVPAVQAKSFSKLVLHSMSHSGGAITARFVYADADGNLDENQDGFSLKIDNLAQFKGQFRAFEAAWDAIEQKLGQVANIQRLERITEEDPSHANQNNLTAAKNQLK